MTDYWSCDDAAEELTHEERDSAIEEYLDGFLAPGMTGADVQAALPAEILVYKYERDVVHPSFDKGECLERLLGDLDEEYGNPNGGMATATEAMKTAEQVFRAAVFAEYEPWACSRVGSETVDVLAWVREHQPDWLA